MGLADRHRRHVALDVLLALWAAVWIFIGVNVGIQVRGLADLSDDVGSIGRSLQSVGETLRALDGLPLVGGRLSEAAGAVEQTGRTAQQGAVESRQRAGQVGVLLGVSIALIPSLPVLLLYLPGRIAYGRDRRAVQRALAGGRDPALDRVLALRAVATLPYQRLRAASPDPGADLAAGRHDRLADAELARLGLRRARS